MKLLSSPTSSRPHQAKTLLRAAPATAAALGVISAALLIAGNGQLAGVVAFLALVPAGLWGRERRRRAEESGLAEREWHFDQRVKTVAPRPLPAKRSRVSGRAFSIPIPFLPAGEAPPAAGPPQGRPPRGHNLHQPRVTSCGCADPRPQPGHVVLWTGARERIEAGPFREAGGGKFTPEHSMEGGMRGVTVLGITGPSGVGKSTLASLLAAHLTKGSSSRHPHKTHLPLTSSA